MPKQAKAKPSKRDETWEFMFASLVQWKEEHGHFNVPRTYKNAGGKCLYDWIRKQREGYRNSLKTPKLWPCLTQDKIDRIRGIGFDLTINGRFTCLKGYQQPEESNDDRQHRSKSYSKQWDIMYKGLMSFKEQHGHLVVPKGYMCGNANLGFWTQAQRQYFRKHYQQKDKPTPWQERIDRLRAIGFELPVAKADSEVEVESEDDEGQLKQSENPSHKTSDSSSSQERSSPQTTDALSLLAGAAASN
jgi:hypothetical protein